jgi:hypothetical protein
MRPALLALCLSLCLPLAVSAAPVTATSEEVQLLALLNKERARLGAPPFRLDAHLIQAARAHSKRMAQQGTISHQFSGEADPSKRMGQTGARFTASGENVAVAGSVDKAHDGLMHSPPHYENIKNAAYDRIGIGIVRSGKRVFVTEDFTHGVVEYNDEQFRGAVAGAINQRRRSGGGGDMLVTPEPWLHQAACAKSKDFDKLHQALPEAAELLVFTASEPDKLPANLDKAALKRDLHRMSLGVCYRPDPRYGYGSFWVIAALYR